MIVRAIFWITAVTVILPYETVQGRNERSVAPAGLNYVSENTADTNFLTEYQLLALRSLQDLKEERSQFQYLVESPDPQE